MTGWTRRARPLLGTLVEIGVPAGADGAAGFDAIARVQRQLSRFEPDSDIGRFAALPAGASLQVGDDTAAVLAFAQALQQRTAGAFDVALGTGAWRLEHGALHKDGETVRLDLGGLGKGHAVDEAVAALQATGIADGWVNAGGDLRVFGDVDLPVRLRDERHGGVAPFVHLGDGALATSHYGEDSRCALHGRLGHAHVSVAAPTCRWADALTKLAAVVGPASVSVGAASAAIRAMPPSIAAEAAPTGIPCWWPALRDDAGATVWWH